MKREKQPLLAEDIPLHIYHPEFNDLATEVVFLDQRDDLRREFKYQTARLKERYELDREEILVNYPAPKKRDSLLSLTAHYNRSLELAGGVYNTRMKELYDKFKC